ncbi:hypothetical protein B0H14DRAFT_1128165 [Mycena olivaceomarginata]|nr:hypothetical protein B0H14DRAFT_1128165 [Mycena olivaceomarginata]
MVNGCTILPARLPIWIASLTPQRDASAICDIVNSTRRNGRSIRAFHSDRRTNKSSNVKPVFHPKITTLIITALVGPRRFHSSFRVDRGVPTANCLAFAHRFSKFLPGYPVRCQPNPFLSVEASCVLTPADRRHFGPGLANPEVPVAEATFVASGKRGIRTRGD